jgi:hypothetical protein
MTLPKYSANAHGTANQAKKVFWNEREPLIGSIERNGVEQWELKDIKKY